MAGTAQPRVKILYIGGVGRSGSTLVERVLDQAQGIHAFGAISKLWEPEYSFDPRQMCVCGETFQACSFWNRVMDEAFGGMDRFDREALARLQLRAARVRYLRHLKAETPRDPFRQRLAEYLEPVERLYRAIARISGGRVIVDSSKTPIHAFALQRIEGFDVFYLHLVRDSRAVACSWQRRKRRPDIHWKETYMPTFRPARVAMQWLFFNALSHVHGIGGNRRLFMRYEDFAHDPATAVARIMHHIGEREALTGGIVDGNRIELKPGHAVTGNPMRFDQSVTIRPDVSWPLEMSRRHQWLVSMLTWPMLLYYGYRPLPAIRSGGQPRARRA